MNTKRFFLTAGLATLGLGLAACGGGEASSASNDSLSVGVIGLTSDVSLEVAQDEGYFEENGMTSVDIRTVSDPPAAIAAVQSGEIDVAYATSIPFFNALSQGIDLTVIASADGYPEGALDMDPVDIDDTGVYVTADSDIDSVADLEGKQVAIPARNAQLEVTINDAIQQEGGDAESVQWMVLDFASALDALENGQIDAASVVSPFTQEAEDRGYTLISSPGVTFFEEGAIGLWVAGTDQVENNPELYEAFQAAMKQAYEYGNENTEEVQEQAAELTGIDLETLQQGAVTYWPIEATYEDLDRQNQKLAELGYLTDKAPFEQDQILGAE